MTLLDGATKTTTTHLWSLPVNPFY